MSVAWVTGAKGFIGRHLVKRLATSGTAVFGLGHGNWPQDVAKQGGVSHWINGGVDANNLLQLLRSGEKPDVIYHLAGGSSVGFSLQHPSEDFQRTVLSTSSLLEFVRSVLPGTPVVAVSSAAIYGNSPLPNLPEEGIYTPYSPYGFHKRMAELMSESYARSFGATITVVRFFSIYGPGLQKQLLWDTCSRLSKHPSHLALHGTGEELRDWLHVEDAVTLLERAGQLRAPNGFTFINGGTGQGTSVSKIVEMLCKAWGSNASVSFSGEVRNGDPRTLVANTDRLKSTTGLPPSRDLFEGISEYVQWYKSQA
jgi:UDP-glucose 4-epimerase